MMDTRWCATFVNSLISFAMAVMISLVDKYLASRFDLSQLVHLQTIGCR